MDYFTDKKTEEEELKKKYKDMTSAEKLNLNSTRLMKVLGLFAGAAVFFYTIASIPSVGIINGTPLLIAGLAIVPFILVVQLVVGYSAYAGWAKKFIEVQKAKGNNTFTKRLKEFFKQMPKQTSLLLKGASEGVFAFMAMMGLCLLANSTLGIGVPMAVIIVLSVIVAVSAMLNQYFQLYDFNESKKTLAQLKKIGKDNKELSFNPKVHNKLVHRNRWFARTMLNLSIAAITAGIGMVLFGMNPAVLIVGAVVGFLAGLVTQAALMKVPTKHSSNKGNNYENYIIPNMQKTQEAIKKLSDSCLKNVMPKTNAGKMALAAIYMAGAFTIIMLSMGIGGIPSMIPTMGIMGLAGGATIAAKLAIVLAIAAVFTFLPTLLVRTIENQLLTNKNKRFADKRKDKFTNGKLIEFEDYTKDELESIIKTNGSSCEINTNDSIFDSYFEAYKIQLSNDVDSFKNESVVDQGTLFNDAYDRIL